MQSVNTMASEASKIQVVFFDAAGTLLEVRGSVGEIYSRVAGQYGIEADAEQLQQNFARWFRLQPPMAFPARTPGERLPELEKGWWRNLVRAVFSDFGAFQHFELPPVVGRPVASNTNPKGSRFMRSSA